MSLNQQIVIDQALALPDEERAEVVEKLLLSLHSAADAARIEGEWKREALDRCRAFDEGRLTERNAVDVMNDAYRRAK